MMSENKIFKSPLRLIVMMVIGLQYVVQNIMLSVLTGIILYVAAVCVERFWNNKQL
jgi:branched-subunit amino acid transport protein AzlD